jgi:hypothetical protein
LTSIVNVPAPVMVSVLPVMLAIVEVPSIVKTGALPAAPVSALSVYVATAP